MMAINGLSSTPIVNWGSDDLKARYLPRIVSGELQASYCLSETDAGSDVAAMKTRAERDGDSYVLDGAKHWITNAGVSDIYVVFAKSDPGAGARGISCFLVEREHGLRIGRLERKMGMHGSPTGEVLLDSVRVPAANRDRRRRPGLHDRHAHARPQPPVDRRSGRGYRPGRARLRNRLYERTESLRPSDCRVPGLAVHGVGHGHEDRGGPPAHLPGLRHHRRGRSGPRLNAVGAMAKTFASDVAMEVTTNGVQLLGGYGYTSDFPMERFMRDAKITQIYEGTNQIQRVVIARNLLR